jgi:hypothetical protein
VSCGPKLDTGDSPGFLGIITAFNENLQASVSELVYGEPLRIPGELLTPTATQWLQRTSSPCSASTWAASDQFQQHATPPGHIRAQRPREVHARLPLSGPNALGFGVPVQRPLPSSVMEREYTATSHERKDRYCVRRQGQAGLQQLQPTLRCHPDRSTTCHVVTARHTHYAIWSPHPFPCLIQYISSHQSVGGGDVGASHSATCAIQSALKTAAPTPIGSRAA